MAIGAALIEVTTTRRVCSSFGSRFLSERSAGGSNAQYAIGSVSNLLSRNNYELDIVYLARVNFNTIADGSCLRCVPDFGGAVWLDPADAT